MTNIAQQQQELRAKIWRIANDVRGSVDGWDFKQFVLGTLFYRFISENKTLLPTLKVVIKVLLIQTIVMIRSHLK